MKGPCFTVDFLAVFGSAGIVSLPVAICLWHVSSPTIGVLPSNRIDIFPATEEASKQGNFSLRVGNMADSIDCCSHALDQGRPLILDRRNWDAVLCQKLPQAAVFLPQTVTFDLRGLELSLEFFARHSCTVILPIQLVI